MGYIGYNFNNIPITPYPPVTTPLHFHENGEELVGSTTTTIPTTTYPPILPKPIIPFIQKPIGPGTVGKLANDGILLDYYGISTDTADVIINNKFRTIRVDVNKHGVDTSFVYTTPVPMDCWNIVHNMNKYPAVTVTDYENNVILADVKYVDMNTVIVKLSEPICGKAFLN